MDAMQKRRALKVATGHFLITLFAFWRLFHSFTPDAWTSFWLKVSIFLQPVFFSFVWALRFINFAGLDGITSFLAGLAMMLSVVLWSICFAWLFVKLDNWLNHFPVLGKRVF
jgi:hypothetical protein